MSTEKKILICLGTSGIAAGGKAVLANFETHLAQAGKADEYRLVSVGDRGLFRDVLVDVIDGLGRTTYEHVRPEDVEDIVQTHIVGGELYAPRAAGADYHEFFASQTRIVLANCGEINPECIDEYCAAGGYAALQAAIFEPAHMLTDTVKASGLRGRGGGGFPTGVKWQFTADAPGEQKYIICNADEGDPGAFMDRAILEGDPHAVVEGMILAGLAVGATEGYIYCRAEYPLAIARLEVAIAQATERGMLGESILNTPKSFTLKIKAGAGAFVCGEETALIASIEGKRGNPVSKPPFPAQSGLWGCPTLINNVETFANVPPIVRNGAEWFAQYGTENSKGTKVFALAGKVKNTGLVEVPMGMTIRHLVDGPGGGMLVKRLPLKGVQLGGPSGGCLPASLLDTPVDYESITQTGAIMGSGGMVVMDTQSCMVDIARFFVEFTVAESCGKCTPCRVGLKRMLEILEDICSGQGTPAHLDFLSEMGETIKSMSLCGLGQTAPNPVLTTMKYYPEEYAAHVEDRECPAHVCAELVDFVVDDDKCIRCGACSRACPAEAVHWQKGQLAKIDSDRCIQCKACISACKFDAIR